MTGQPLPDGERGLWFELTAVCEVVADRSVGAVVTVAARRGGHGAVGAAGNAVVIIMDRSLSMGRMGKLDAAREAVAAAIDALSEQTYFAIIAGKHDAEPVYPPDRTLCRATPAAKRHAKDLLARVGAAGGTEIGTWLRLARELFRQVPHAVPRAVLYTDGIDEHEPATALDSALRACHGHFVCDVRGVGADWDPGALRRITSALQGELVAITDIADLRSDFVRLVEYAQTPLVPRVFLRFSLDRHFRLESVHEVDPPQNDLTGHRLPQDGGVTDIPLLAWGEEERAYLVMLRAEPGTPVSEEIRAARVDVLARRAEGGPLEPCAGGAAVVVRWPSHRDPPSARSSVTEAGDRLRLTAARRAGVAAYRQGDKTAALAEFTIAVRLADSLGESAELELLLRLVTIDEFRTVHLRPDITPSDLLNADAGSSSHSAAHGAGRPSPARLEPPASPTRRVLPGSEQRNIGQPGSEQRNSGQRSSGQRNSGQRSSGQRNSERPGSEQPGRGLGLAGSGGAEPPPLAPGMVTRVCPDNHRTVGYFVLKCEANGCTYEFGDEEDRGREAGGDGG